MCFKFLHAAPLSYCYFDKRFFFFFKIKLFIWSLNYVFTLVCVCVCVDIYFPCNIPFLIINQEQDRWRPLQPIKQVMITHVNVM